MAAPRLGKWKTQCESWKGFQQNEETDRWRWRPHQESKEWEWLAGKMTVGDGWEVELEREQWRRHEGQSMGSLSMPKLLPQFPHL
jgi:hypothetical protein